MEELFFKRSGKGKPVLLLHGFCETQEVWETTAADLATEFEIFSLDLPGFGQSPLLPTPFTIVDVAAVLLKWIEKNHIHPFVVGHSLGGYVALAMAEKIAGLCLFHSTPNPDSEERKINRNRVMEFVKTHGVGPFVDTFVPGLFLDKKHVAISAVDRIARRTTTETLLAYTIAMRDRPSSIDVMKQINRPMLIMAGEQDSIIPLDSLKPFAVLAELHVLPDTAHMAMYEQPEMAARVLKDFIRKM